MQSFTAHEAARKFGDLIAAARKAPVAVTRYGRPAAVVISVSDYRAYLRLAEKARLDELSAAVAAIEKASANDDYKAVAHLAKLIRPYRR